MPRSPLAYIINTRKKHKQKQEKSYGEIDINRKIIR